MPAEFLQREGEVTNSDAVGRSWALRRNCAMSPYQLLAIFGAIATVSLSIAVFWALMGHWVILPYALLECVALGLAFLVYCRHAQDGQWVAVRGGVVEVEERVGGRICRQDLPLHGLRITVHPEDRSGLVCLDSGVAQATVGRFVDQKSRHRFYKEFRQALSGQSQLVLPS